MRDCRRQTGSPAGQDAARAWGKPVEGQAISISTERSAYAPGDRVVVKIRFKNLGTKDVRAGTSGILNDYELAVSISEGAFRKRTIAAERGVISLIPENGQVPHTLFGKAKLEALRHGGFFGGVLKPGEYRSAAIDLTRLFDMSLEGKYVISVQRRVWDGKEFRKKATSNELEVAIDGRLGNPVEVNLGKGPTPEEAKEKAGK